MNFKPILTIFYSVNFILFIERNLFRISRDLTGIVRTGRTPLFRRYYGGSVGQTREILGQVGIAIGSRDQTKDRRENISWRIWREILFESLSLFSSLFWRINPALASSTEPEIRLNKKGKKR